MKNVKNVVQKWWMVWRGILHQVVFASLISLPNATQGTELLVC